MLHICKSCVVYRTTASIVWGENRLWSQGQQAYDTHPAKLLIDSTTLDTQHVYTTVHGLLLEDCTVKMLSFAWVVLAGLGLVALTCSRQTERQV